MHTPEDHSAADLPAGGLTTAPETTTVVEGEPNMAALYGRAVASAVMPGAGDALPTEHLARVDVAIDRDHVADYADVCGFRISDVLPSTYLHLLMFPLSIQLMARQDFPFALPGLVHVGNRIVTRRAVNVAETVDVTVGCVDLRAHAKGQQFDVAARASIGGDLVWESRSTYLRRGRPEGALVDGDHPSEHVDVNGLPFTARWSVPADTGRRYAGVSGDVNPIHLNPVTARAFGFPRAIAHGMWTAARVVAAFEGSLPDALDLDVSFKRPVLLPAKVELATRVTDDLVDAAVRGRDGAPHLAARITPAG